MQKSRVGVPAFLITLPVMVSCILRFFLLLRYTDEDTGLITGGKALLIAMYALLILFAVLAALHSRSKELCNNLLSINKNTRTVSVVTLVTAVSFFFDFVHQCINTYYEFSRDGYADYLYLTVLVLCALLALICSFYFLSCYTTQSGSNYDFKNLKLFHFAPVMWGISRLLVMLQKIIDIRSNAESLIEIVFLSCILGFFICFVAVLDKNGVGSGALVFFAYCAFFFCGIAYCSQAFNYACRQGGASL